MKRPAPAFHLRALAVAALTLLLGMTWGCDRGAQQPASHKAAAVSAAPSAGTGGSIWDERCSACHTREDQQGLGADDISAALREIPAMGEVRRTVSAAEIKTLVRELAGD